MQVIPVDSSTPQNTPESASSSVLVGPSLHAHNAAFSYFFSVASPWTFAKNLMSRTFCAMRSFICHSIDSLITLCKNTSLKVYAFIVPFFSQCFRSDLVVGILSRIVTYFLKDNGYDEKINHYKLQLQLKSASNVYAETSKVIESAILQGFDTYVIHAKEVDKEVRPDFVTTSILVDQDQENIEYRLSGKLAMVLFEKKQELFKKVIECNLLKVFSHLVDLLLNVQGKNRYALLDLVLDAMQKVPMHFYECKNREAAIREETFVPLQPQIFEKNKKLFFQVLADAALSFAFPHGAKDLELPFSQTICSYLSTYIFDMLKQEILPDAFQALFAKQSTPLCKNYLFYKLFKFMHKGIDETHESVDTQDPVAIQYPRQDEMINALYECVHCFLEYVDPTFLPWILKTYAPDNIAKKLAFVLSQKLQSLTLQESFSLSLEKALPQINAGGAWVEKDGKQEFKVVPFTFETKHGQKQETLTVQAQKTERRKRAIETYIETIGKNPQGLEQLVQSGIFAVSSPDLAKQESQTEVTSTWFSYIGSTLSSLYTSTSKAVVNGAFYLGDLPNRIQTLNRALWEKMKDPQHELLTFDFTQCVITLLKPGTEFPELRNARYTKKNQSE